jgi:membrane-bound serine protease (ClpP class)
MSLIIGIIIAFVFFDMPWTAVILAAFVVFDFFEISIWLRWRKRRAITGAEGIIGAQGTAVTALDPEGMVFVKGQNWKGRSGEHVPANTKIEVIATSDLLLEVRPIETPAPTIPT